MSRHTAQRRDSSKSGDASAVASGDAASADSAASNVVSLNMLSMSVLVELSPMMLFACLVVVPQYLLLLNMLCQKKNAETTSAEAWLNCMYSDINVTSATQQRGTKQILMVHSNNSAKPRFPVAQYSIHSRHSKSLIRCLQTVARLHPLGL